jgi:ketosteroid isomerase-like protein
MPRLRLAAATLVLAVVPAAPVAAQDMPAHLSPPRAALWREVRAVNDSMQTAFGRGDMKAVANFYADDAKMAGQGQMVVGRAALDAYWARLGATPGTWKLDVLEVGGTRDLAYQRGRSTLTLRAADGTTRLPMVVDFVVIWRRDSGGGLRILMDLY